MKIIMAALIPMAFALNGTVFAEGTKAGHKHENHDHGHKHENHDHGKKHENHDHGKKHENHDHAKKAELAPEVSADEFKKLVDTKGATIIDVNGMDMYNSGHVPGAVNFAQHEKNLSAVLPADKNSLIVAYCGGPMCTAWEEAAKKAMEMGYKNVKHFKGGIKVWKERGFTVETASAGKSG